MRVLVPRGGGFVSDMYGTQSGSCVGFRLDGYLWEKSGKEERNTAYMSIVVCFLCFFRQGIAI